MALLRILIALFFFILFEFDILKNKIVLNIVNILLLLLPIISFVSAATGGFNPMATDQYIGQTNYGNESLVDDTRTLLYQEAINSSLENGYVVWGRTFGYGYDSDWQTIRNDINKNVIAQRNAEVFIINIYTWMGLMGVS